MFTRDRMVYIWYGRGKPAVRIVSQREREHEKVEGHQKKRQISRDKS